MVLQQAYLPPPEQLEQLLGAAKLVQVAGQYHQCRAAALADAVKAHPTAAAILANGAPVGPARTARPAAQSASPGTIPGTPAASRAGDFFSSAMVLS